MYHFINLQLNIPNGLNISGRVQCDERNTSEYRVSHKNPATQEEIPGPHYEINISSILPQIFNEEVAKDFFESKFENEEDERERLRKLVSGHHILIGSDRLPYVCCPMLHEAHLIVMTKLWLAHQILYSKTGHNIVHFQSFLKTEQTTFKKWLENDDDMKDVPAKEKDFILADKSLFMKVKRIYKHEKLDGKKRWHVDYVADSVLKAFNAKASIELL